MYNLVLACLTCIICIIRQDYINVSINTIVDSIKCVQCILLNPKYITWQYMTNIHGVMLKFFYTGCLESV